MATAKSPPKSLVDAVQSVFEALEPFDEDARQRILTSAVSLFGTGLGLAVATRALSQTPSTPASVPRVMSDRPISPVELLHEKRPATNAQRIAVFAYYRERVDGLARFAKDDLKPYFAKAKLPPPQNFDRDYRQVIKLGWIYDDGTDSYLTSKGLEAVEAGFEGKALPRGAPTAKAKRSRPKKPRTKR